MSELVAVAYPDEHRAAEVMAALQRMKNEYLVDLDDASYVTKDANGKLKLHQSHDLTGGGAVWGGMWGMLIGLLFFVPVFGLAIGAAAGALAGHFTDYGIDKDFVKQLSAAMQPGSSAIFMLVRTATPDKAVAELSKFGGTILRTSLSAETEQKLQAALNQGVAAQQAAQAQGVPSASASSGTGA
jgi:uncharacterized membrane protein